MAATIDISGKQFDRLTVIEWHDRKRVGKKSVLMWRCRCSCGQETIVEGGNLRGGKVRSCGCLRVERVRESAKRLRKLTDEQYQRIIAKATDPKALTGWQAAFAREFGVTRAAVGLIVKRTRREAAAAAAAAPLQEAA